MKKVSLILTALALVLGISQCKKQEDPVGGKVVTQKVTFTTSFGDGSKVGVQENLGALNLSWKVGDAITVADEAGHSKTLTCTEVSNGGLTGTFTGEIEYGSGNLTFTAGTEPSYMDQHFTAITESEIYLKGTSDFVESGDYDVNMTMPYAILKLDLAELATAEGVDVSVKIGDATEPVAKISSVKTADSQVYLLLPLQASGETTLTFTNGTKTITKTYNLAPNSFNTAGGTGDYAPVEPVTPKFSVSATTKVEFAPGNLWYGIADRESTPAFHFEANQWSSASTWDASHVSYFFWSKTASVAYAQIYNDGGTSTTDVFFTDASDFQVSGETAGTWRTLSKAQWDYLLETRTGASNLCAWKELDSGAHKGLVILPDGTDVSVMSRITTTDALATHGAVFLPVAGYYLDFSGVSNADSNGYYWSSTPFEDLSSSAFYINFDSGNHVYKMIIFRSHGYSVRLVRNITE